MYELNEVIGIDRRFQNSVNLSMDLNNQKKIDSYIPTRSAKSILNWYQKSVEQNTDNATILIGPYGKGKSHLLLVLSDQLRKREKPFLPVIVSGTYEDLNQAFLMGILDALKREDLSDLAPESYYSKAIDTIELWKKQYPMAYEIFLQEITAFGYQEKDYHKQLERLNEKVLRNFRKIYPKITNGSEFQPIVELETTKIYQEISRLLYEKYQYAGIFIVFDEFSKYIEGHQVETFARDMKIVQDMCELCNSSKNPQMHITFVAHKSIKEYGTALPKEMVHAFTGVEGRLKEVPFIVSSQNNYELIEHVIEKKIPDFNKYIRSLKPYYENAQKSYGLQFFHSLFEAEDFEKIMVMGCYPLLPVTVYLLLAISEKVAQNERSIFTFLANDEKGSLYRMIKERQGEIKDGGVTADVVYDYFCNLFREETGLVSIHTEWLKADYALTKTTDKTEQKIIKVMALLLMLHRISEAPVEKEILSLALNLQEESLVAYMESLCEKQVVEWKHQSASYVFRNNVGIDLEKEIKDVMAKIPAQANDAKVIREISELDYILPKQHNQENTISRFFEYVYMTKEQFLKLPDAKYLFEEHFSDGKLIALLSEETEDRLEQEITDKIHTLQDKRIVVLCPYDVFSGKSLLRRYLAVLKLLEDTEFLEQNRVLKQELENNADDIRYELNQMLKKSYLPEEGNCAVIHMSGVYPHDVWKKKTFNSFLSTVCDEVYPKTPRVNNELINRQHISSQNKKARKKIVEMLLLEQGEEVRQKYETGTGPEATIYRATLQRTGIRGSRQLDPGSKFVLDEINAFIADCDGRKISFQKLYERLLGEEYGARRGILPIYIATQLIRLQGTPVIYFGDREVELKADVFENINDQPENYSLYVEHETTEKQKYLQNLEELFSIDGQEHKQDAKDKRLKQIAVSMHRWYRSLPQVTLNFKNCPSDMTKKRFKEILAFRRLFRNIELNPRELLFEKIPEIFGNEEYAKTAKKVSQIKLFLDSYFKSLQQQAVTAVKEEFRAKENESLSACLSHWYEGQSQMAKTLLSGSRVTGFMQYMAQLDTYDELKIIRRLSKIILDLYMEDWQDTSLEEFKKMLHETRQEIETIGQNDSTHAGRQHLVFTNHQGEKIERFYEDTEDDSTSYFLKNAILDALEEFGDSLETNQKVAVLVQTLEKLIQS